MSAVTSLSPSATAWRAWLTANGPRLLLFAKNQTRNAQDAEDVLQDALVKLVEKPLLDVVMSQSGQNQSRAAEWLGLNRNTLRKKLLEHELLK